jgi:hypothetical protein
MEEATLMPNSLKLEIHLVVGKNDKLLELELV